MKKFIIIKLIPVAVLRESRGIVDGGLVEAVAAVAVEPDPHGFEVAVSVHSGFVSATRFELLYATFVTS